MGLFVLLSTQFISTIQSLLGVFIFGCSKFTIKFGQIISTIAIYLITIIRLLIERIYFLNNTNTPLHTKEQYIPVW